MNTPNPLIPQGSLQSRGKSTVRIAFFSILAIHVLVFGGLLMQGCKKSEDKAVVVEDTNEVAPLPPIDLADTNVADTNYAAPTVSNAAPPEVAPPAYEVTPAVAPEPTASREYVITKGDSFSSIAKKMGVSVRAIEQANPGVNPSRLQIGKKLQIPAAGDTTSTSSSSARAPGNGDSTTYTVKSGDMLEKIARRHGTTAKTIMRLNNLKTTMIKPGQKLKLPTSAPVTAPEPPTSPNYVTPLPTP